MEFENYEEKDFWRNIFVEVVSSGRGSEEGIYIADQAVEAFRFRRQEAGNDND